MARTTQEAERLIAYAVRQPLHRSKPPIYTLDMKPWVKPVRVDQGPTTLTVAIQLARPERDLGRALKLGPAMEQYIAKCFDLAPGKAVPVRVTAVGAHIMVEAPKLEKAYRPTYGQLAEHAGEHLLVGLDSYNHAVALDLAEVLPGLKVVGRSGSGKSNAMRLIAGQAAARGWRPYLADLKGGNDWRDFAPFLARPGAYSDEDARALMVTLISEMDRRNSSGTLDHDPILLIFDELPAASKDVQAGLAQIAARGRSANIRLLLGAQRWGNEVDKMIRANITWGLVGLCGSAQESYWATGIQGAGADKLQGMGDMLLIQDGRDMTRVQVARADRADIADLLATVERRAAGAVTVREEPAAPATELPRTAVEAEEMLFRRAAEAADGRVVLPAAMIGSAVYVAIRTGRPPSFKLIQRWAKRHLGKQVAKPRGDELRELASMIAEAWRSGLFCPVTPEGEPLWELSGAWNSALIRPHNGRNAAITGRNAGHNAGGEAWARD